MTSFFVELWTSIFTPGPTPVLLKATNATFAALQVLLFLLYLSIHSIHLIVLSVLCGGLWWAINWFARELAIHTAQVEAEEAKKKRLEARTENPIKDVQSPPSDADDDTEVDDATPEPDHAMKRSTESVIDPIAEHDHEEDIAEASVAAVPLEPVLGGRDVEPVQKTGELKRRAEASGMHSGMSTEDEWERVSEFEKDK
ncbi:hypothetical protein TD95_004234 [Thielaviopsis punctulata]|uniref:Pkr1-domain-containing protein n=1 Tax=Thielaviopsis punctulata TaxID=72032 RepID=A0A0F4Z7F0_9PEZI|nr:hypothetical protein TD95_004234 [Thielaviopsis punctulata]